MKTTSGTFSRVQWVGAVAALGLLASVAACGEEDPNDGLVSGTGAAAAASYDAYNELIIEASCASYVRCCGEAIGLTLAQCIEAEGGGTDNSDADRAAVEAGRVRLDANAARSCAALLRADECGGDGGFFDEDSPCYRIAVGNVSNGGRCFNEGECSDGVCAFDDETDTEGTCTPAAEGDPCVTTCRTFSDGDRECSAECAGVLYCEAEVCVREEPLPGVGEPCGESCDYGTWCNPDGICEATQPVGAPCATDEACTTYACVDGQCELGEICF